MEWRQEPVRVWHVLVLMIGFGITLVNLQKQLNAIGKCSYEVWERLCGGPAD
jgi:hypothetical protein